MFNSRKMTLPDLTSVADYIISKNEYKKYGELAHKITAQKYIFSWVIYEVLENKRTDDKKYMLERILLRCGLTGHSIESDLIRLSGLAGGNYVYIPLIYKNTYKQNKRKYIYIINNKMI
jgi:hypothetical protein